MGGEDARGRDRDGRTGPTDGVDPSERLSRLGARLEELRRAHEGGRSGEPGKSSAFAEGLKLASEFASAVLVGGGIGYLIDRWLGTLPFGLILFLLLGFAAGVVNVLRSAGLVARPGAAGRGRDNRDDGRPPPSGAAG